MKRFLVLVSLLAIVPLVAAHEPNPNGNCDNVGDATLVVEGIRVAVDTVYVTAEPGVWTESNGVPGLQTHEHVCRTSPRADPAPVGPDTRVL